MSGSAAALPIRVAAPPPRPRRFAGALRVMAIAALVVAVGLLVVLGIGITSPRLDAIAFPGGKRFAFSIVDDTDLTMLERVRPVYEILSKYKMRTTKSVWVLDPTNTEKVDTNRGETLSNPEYLAFVKDLQSRGFEIALHGVRGGSSDRADIILGLDTFKQALGGDPTMHINHSRNLDNVYWNRSRYSLAPYRWSAGMLMAEESFGHDPTSRHFWGDLVKERIRYIRQFTFQEVNLLKVNPSMPYRRPDTPYANLWFQTSNGANMDAFEKLLQPANLDQLEREGGVCLVYAHLGAGSFSRPSSLQRFEERIRDLTSRNGWFAPASEILDFLGSRPGWTGQLSSVERLRLETQFTVSRVIYGGG